METRQRRTFSGREGTTAGRQPKHSGAKTNEDRNRAQRAQYASDPEHADRVRAASRNNYRRNNPLPDNPLRNGLLRGGNIKELFVEEMDHPVSTEAFTLPEAAEALGKSLQTLNRWIEDGVIPPPYLRDTSRGYRHYSIGELRTIARVLSEHCEDFMYVASSHSSTIHTMWQQVQAYRAHSV